MKYQLKTYYLIIFSLKLDEMATINQFIIQSFAQSIKSECVILIKTSKQITRKATEHSLLEAYKSKSIKIRLRWFNTLEMVDGTCLLSSMASSFFCILVWLQCFFGSFQTRRIQTELNIDGREQELNNNTHCSD